METIQAILVNVRHKGNGTNWKVCGFKLRERSDLFNNTNFAASGPIPDGKPDDLYELQGDWEQHEKYGKQFKVSDASLVIPEDLAGLEKFLAQRVNGIGPAMASKMALHFGAELRYVLDNNPTRFIEIGLSSEKILEIDKTWNSDRHLRAIGIFLASHGIKIKSWAKKIFDQFGANCPQLVSENPYILTHVSGIGFTKSDEMAKKMGWPATSPQRTEAACMYALEEARDAGHVFLFRHELLDQVGTLAGVRLTASEDYESGGDNVAYVEAMDIEAVSVAIDACIDRGEVIQESLIVDGKMLIMEYLPYLHFYEKTLAARLVTHLGVAPRASTGLPALIAEAEKSFGMTLSDKQQKAVIAAMQNSISVITGGPGVGKTFVTKVILFCMKKLGWVVAMAAPTGRAAKRMAEVTNHDASTVHRLLTFKDGVWTKNRQDPLTCDALFLDEWSMGDTALSYQVMEAVPTGCHVVLIGDVDQLPSVGPGMILKDLIDSGCVPVTRLDTIFRQAEGSLIVRNAHKIIHGELPVFPAKGDMTADNFVMFVPQIDNGTKKVDDVDWVHAQLKFMTKEYLPTRYGVNPMTDIQVLAPMKKGSCGTEVLNDVLHLALNPDGEPIYVNGRKFHVGDRVMQMKNDYTINIFNGDIGIILGNNEESQALRIRFDQTEVDYLWEKARGLQLAFASTVHKFQGCELPIVIIVLLGQHFTMLERNLVYTALTRAKKMCLFITTKRALAMAVQRCNIQKRNSFLGDLIRMARTIQVIESGPVRRLPSGMPAAMVTRKQLA